MTALQAETPGDVLKPLLRGWIHLGMFPASLLACLVLVVVAPTTQARWACAAFAATSWTLFGVSAAYHRGNWSARAERVLRRLDHSNIYLIIAGTYTPFAVLALEGVVRAVVLSVVWTGALLGVAFRVAWPYAPRWLYVPLYLALGWVAVLFLPQLLEGAGVAAVTLVIIGGAFYTFGGVVYGLRRPNPWPGVAGHHEIFHACTCVAYILHFIAVALVVAKVT